MDFNPNGTATTDSGLFALPSSTDSPLHILSVPWDATTSYGNGTWRGPDCILTSSKQLDLCHPLFPDFYDKGVYQHPSPQWLVESNETQRTNAAQIQKCLENGKPLDRSLKNTQAAVNEASQKVNTWLAQKSESLLSQGKLVGVVGGDHSSPFGFLQTLSARYKDLSILHIDAHMDLRLSYQGFEHSHASIMRNVCEHKLASKIVQVGIRDYCPEERQFAETSPWISVFYDSETRLQMHRGDTWQEICTKIISKLSQNVYISLDVDGLTPSLCPNTGTPVPGGLSFAEITTLLSLSLIHI